MEAPYACAVGELYSHVGTFQEQIRLFLNKAFILRSRTRHFAGRIIGPVTVKADDTPIDAPAGPNHPGVLANRVMDGVPKTVGDERNSAAEASRYAVHRRGAECGLAHLLKTADGQGGIPEGAFLLSEARADRAQGRVGVAGRQYAIMARAREKEVQFEQVRRSRRSCRHGGEHHSKSKNTPRGAAAHGRSPFTAPS